MRRLLTSFGILLCLSVPAGQVPAVPPAAQMTFPVKGTGLVSGQVVDAHGSGVANAVVTLSGGLQQIALTLQVGEIAGGPRRTLTSGEGQFVFFDLPAGGYTIDVTKPGFLPGAFGRRRFGGSAQSLQLGDGERRLQLRVPIWEYASISGRLVDEAGEPMVGVRVRGLSRVIWRGRAHWTLGPSASTDDRGEYRLDAIEPGEYLVVVAATPVTVPVTVVDVMAAEQQSGARPDAMLRLMNSGLASSLSATGATRIGEWAVMNESQVAVAPLPQNETRAFVYPTTFYPGTRSLAEAQTVVVGSGEARLAVDFSMPLTPAGTIRGVVNGPDGPAGGLALHLLPDYADRLNVDALNVAGAVTDAAGRFAMIGVPAGHYTLRSFPNPPTGVGGPSSAVPPPVHWLMQPVTVAESDPPSLALTLRPGVTVRGRIEFDGTSLKPGPDIIQKLFAGLEPLDAYMPRAQGTYQVNFDRSGQFVIPNVVPGRYSVRYAAFLEERRAMPAWETIGGMLNGKDISSRPLSITSDLDGIAIVLSDHPSELTGTVRGADSNLDPDAAVVLFTAERDLWTSMPSFTRRMRSVRTSENGTFLMRGIPPGDYYLAAIPEDQAADWQDPRVLDQISRDAVRLSITYSEKKAQDLKTRSSR